MTQEKLRQKEALRDLEAYKQKDMNRMKQEHEEMERMLRDRIAKMESQVGGDRRGQSSMCTG